MTQQIGPAHPTFGVLALEFDSGSSTCSVHGGVI